MEHLTAIAFLFIITSFCVLFTPSWCLGPKPHPPLKNYAGTRGRSPIAKRVQFHVLLRPQRDECFYEEGSAGSHHSVYFQVMNEDAKVRFSAKGPLGSTPIRDTSVRGQHTQTLEVDGEYSYCFMNYNRAYLKLEFMLTVIDKSQERKLYEESRDVPLEYQNVWNTTLDLLTNVDKMFRYMFQQRREFYYDRLLVESNGQFVAYWSFAQCCVIVLASVIQVYVLRTMFRTVLVTPTNKPRS
ncbi:Transmembrane emp24 domain-containing protein 6 [Holothuria leucospilota]|uniref:Transmembrane emp24 domain-containing protein 6 n=1 Tax=Holothuria leucospilota TaxID=206669 RepID=A0A9Q0YIK3_HOLLE|nr:Transmembrane emp24 domain-containing protein 6 [Holothuria leucospilota]